MNNPIEQKVAHWDENVESGEINKFNFINRQIIYLNKRLYQDYEPHLSSKKDFFSRLNSWLDNIADETHKQILFELIPKLFYVGREELNLLYKEAYVTNYAKWLITTTGFDFAILYGKSTLKDLVTDTWFCPLTDSLRINQFYHINDIPGKHDYRPDWRSLLQFGDVSKIKDYINEQQIKRIVLLEDFIGNGGQVSKAVLFAIKNLKDVPILIIPLIICPAGLKASKKLEDENPNVKIDPVVCIREESLVKVILEENLSDFFKTLHPLLVNSYPIVSNSEIIDANIDPYGPFGWRNTGGLIVMHTNTPNNTLPMIHYSSETWTPLFKRHKRI